MWGDSYGAHGPDGGQLGNDTLTPYRLFRWSSPGSAIQAGDGQDVDGVVHISSPGRAGYFAQPGLTVKVESGGVFSAGNVLQSDASGRAILKGAGVGVLRALEASTAAGQIVWAVFTSGR